MQTKTNRPVEQRRLHSLLESVVNVLIGFGIALLTQYVTFPWFGIEASIGSHLGITAIFTVVSLVRGYVLRRAFNAWHTRVA